MIRRFVVLATLMVIVGALAGPAGAQDADSLPLRIEGMDTTEHPEVAMVVSVPPEMVGKNLTSDAFTVTEAGHERPVTATLVSTEGLQVVLLLDASGSMKGEAIVAARAAAQDFLDSMPGGVEVAVVSFADEPTVLSPFTTDMEQASAAISDLRLGKNTALYDGLVAGAEMFDGDVDTQHTLVLLSDGGDTASVTNLEDAIISLLDAEVGFYAVELQSSEYDPEALARLAVATDGIVVPVEDPEALAAVFVDIAGQIVNRYELRYTSEAYGPTTVVVEAEVDGVVAAAGQEVRYPASEPVPVPTEPSDPVTEAVVDTVAIAPALRSGSMVVLGWAQSPVALWIGALLVFVALAALLVFIGIVRPKEKRVAPAVASRRFGESKGKALSSLAGQATLLAERTVDRGEGAAGPVTVLLERAGSRVRAGEFVVMSVAAAVGVAAVTYLLATAWLALLLGILTLVLIRAVMVRRASKRQEAFAKQLPDVLQLMVGSIRSGFGLMQAMDTVAAEIPTPAGEEFQRVKIETQLGRDTNEALRAMAKRVGSEDFKWVVEAIEIHSEVGGDLADILESVMVTVRDRIRIRRRIKTLSAEGRMSGWVLSLLPFALVGVLLIVSPGYLSSLLTTRVGNVLVVVGLVLMAIGALWMRRITALKF
ncbi:MAG: type II secretion system F family protein [Actinomycetota bacterium]|nr:type II secretion system F family protein [Actinomycetota bacterium]